MKTTNVVARWKKQKNPIVWDTVWYTDHQYRLWGRLHRMEKSARSRGDMVSAYCIVLMTHQLNARLEEMKVEA